MSSFCSPPPMATTRSWASAGGVGPFSAAPPGRRRWRFSTSGAMTARPSVRGRSTIDPTGRRATPLPGGRRVNDPQRCGEPPGSPNARPAGRRQTPPSARPRTVKPRISRLADSPRSSKDQGPARRWARRPPGKAGIAADVVPGTAQRASVRRRHYQGRVQRLRGVGHCDPGGTSGARTCPPTRPSPSEPAEPGSGHVVRRGT